MACEVFLIANEVLLIRPHAQLIIGEGGSQDWKR